MKLLFDVGNTLIKAARYENGEFSLLPSVSSGVDFAIPREWEAAQTPREVCVASVANEKVFLHLAKWARQRWSCDITRIRVTQDFAGLRTNYADPQQLGVDRWLAALGGYHLANRQGVCVIDAGTALTVDLVDKGGTHHGGLIAPGIELMVNSLAKGTEQLALENISVPDIFATNTEAAISLGCADYVAGMIERVGQRIKRQSMSIDTWYITGGQGELVASLCDQQMLHVPELVLRGIAIAAESHS